MNENYSYGNRVIPQASKNKAMFEGCGALLSIDFNISRFGVGLLLLDWWGGN